ncbi:MAG: PKD domain-containing protein [Oleispira sp.]
MLFKLIRFSLVAIIMMALSGCFGDDRSSSEAVEQKAPAPEVPVIPDPEELPVVTYSVELDAPNSVTQNTVFSMTAAAKGNEGAVSYQWSLNNGVISADAVHHTMLPALGDYTLTVVATDEKGNEDTQSQTVSVIAQASINPDFSFSINVSDKAGYALVEAPVTINGKTVITDPYGLAQFDGISQTSLMLVSASKAGYLTQTYQYSFDASQESAVANLTLQNINPVNHTVDSTEAVDITETELHTKLMLAANSFVDAQGNAVTGEVDITITPIDIRAVDTAFLGGGQALTDSGEAVALISTGMADYQFSQNGAAVSLAEGASATIEMDLAVSTGDDGRVFVEGDTIEMWWFDSATGFWIEDGVGTVQLSATSETGLKLVATVNHFTTWNWDYYKQDDRSSITFNCLKDGQPLLTNEICQITASSTSINRQFVASSEGVTVINTAPNVTYAVTANSTAGSSLWSGTATITTMSGSNNVSVDMMSVPAKTGYIQCRVINNVVTSIVPCQSLITADSIGNQNIDTAELNNYRASFLYVKGDVLNISATIDSGLNRVKLIDTSSINGTLDVELIFDIKYGSLQCSATLSGADMQYFPCEALVTDSEESSFPIWTEDFSGTPPKANFTYSNNTQQLTIDVASIFDDARLRQNSRRSYISGQATRIEIDLATESAAAYVMYDANPDDLYTFRCIDDMGMDINCDIRWYSPMESIIFSGNIDELSGPEILPTWMNGRVSIKQPFDGWGNARHGDQSLYTENYMIDAMNKIITFSLTLGEVPR